MLQTLSVSERQVRDDLQSRRVRLDQARAAGLAGVHQLIEDVDAALARIETGTYGLCETCHDAIEADRLAADPLARVCLDHLSREQRDVLERDLSMAGEIQRGLLPTHDLAFDGWLMHYAYRPAGPVSGDYCDVIVGPGGTATAVIADVSGKGIAASLLMANLHALFHTLVAAGTPFGELAPRVNRLFSDSTLSSSYATAALVALAPDGEVQVCNAGHCPPLLARDGTIEPIPATGMALGMFRDGEFACVRRRLAPGDAVLLYTDGVTETFDARDEEYGLDRLRRALSPRPGARGPREIVGACLADVAAFRGDVPPRDDLTLAMIQRG
jgi:sigma-B regulation protein RsbU (phosphoserine phosphatase)